MAEVRREVSQQLTCSLPEWKDLAGCGTVLAMTTKEAVEQSSGGGYEQGGRRRGSLGRTHHLSIQQMVPRCGALGLHT